MRRQETETHRRAASSRLDPSKFCCQFDLNRRRASRLEVTRPSLPHRLRPSRSSVGGSSQLSEFRRSLGVTVRPVRSGRPARRGRGRTGLTRAAATAPAAGPDLVTGATCDSESLYTSLRFWMSKFQSSKVSPCGSACSHDELEGYEHQRSLQRRQREP